MPTISVIIPIYNVSAYLRQCVDSVIKQDYKEVEIILVNDGSIDDSLAICKQYKDENSNVILIDKENGGLSDARNSGMAIAKGEYIYFLDGDDWLSPSALRTLYEYAIKTNCEVVQGGIYYVYNNRIIFDNSNTTTSTTLSREDAMRELILNKLIKNFAWGKLYKKDIVQRHLFPIGKYFEDSYWQHLIIHEITKYGIVPSPLYYYRQRRDSISGTLSLKGLDLLKGQEERLNFVKKEYPKLTKDILQIYLNTVYTYYRTAYKLKDKTLKAQYLAYWEHMNTTYGNQMESILGNEYLCRKLVVRWHVCLMYDIVTRLKNKVNTCFLKQKK